MRALRILEKLAFSRYLDNYKNLYLILNSKSIITAVIYHNPAKDNFILATLKSKGSKLNGNIPLLLQNDDNRSMMGLTRMGLIYKREELKIIKDPKDIAQYIITGAKKLGLIKKYYGLLNKSSFIKAMTTKEGVGIAQLKSLIPIADFKPEGEHFHGFNIIGDKEKDIDNAKELLASVYDAYKKIGLHKKLLYGDIFLTNALTAGLLADYSSSEDTVRLTNKARKSKDSIRTMVHELAHRWYRKLLSDDQRKKIKAKYDDMMSQVAGSKSLVIGDRYDHYKLGEIEVESKEYNKRTYTPYYVFKVLKDNKRYRISGAGDLRDSKKLSGDEDVFDAFDVSNYGRTTDTEFWPEVVATALTTNNKDLLDWVKEFTK